MLKQIVMIGAIAAAFGLGPAVAQQSPASQPQMQTAQNKVMDIDLLGLGVYSSDGQMLGKVTEAMADGTIHVDVGQYLGIDKKTVGIKSDQYERQGERINLKIDSENVSSLPEVMAN